MSKEWEKSNLDSRQTVFTYEEYNQYFQPYETKKAL